MSRLKASSIHLAITLIALVIVFLLTRFLWYPSPLLRVDGGVQAFGLLVGVSLVLGPLLTAFVFRSGKRGLISDMALIGIAQILAFGFCVHLLYVRRIQIVVYSQGAFHSLDRAHIAFIGPKGRALLRAAHKRPLYVYVHLPHDKLAMEGVEIRTLRGEPPIFLRGWRYRPYTAQERKRVALKGFPLIKLAETNPKAAQALARFRSHHRALSHYTFVPLYGTESAAILAINRADGRVAGVLRFNPGIGSE